ncbi:MAG: helix-turn-helix domain-containing protein, partial [Desulfuromonadaceae bacterium]
MPQDKKPSDSTVESFLTFHEKLPNLKQAADLLVAEAMRRTKGNQALAAKLLGITPPSLSARLKKIKA